MTNPALRTVALNAFNDESDTLAAEAASKDAAQVPAEVTRRLAKLQNIYDALVAPMNNMIDALNFALASTGGVSGIVFPGIAGSSPPSFMLGSTGRVRVTFHGADDDGTTPLWRVNGAVSMIDRPAPVIARLSRYYARSPSAAL